MNARQHYAALAERAAEEVLSAAEQEVVDEILGGQEVSGFALGTVIDEELNRLDDIRPLMADLGKRLAALFAAPYRSDAHVLATADLQLWAEPMIRRICQRDCSALHRAVEKRAAAIENADPRDDYDPRSEERMPAFGARVAA